MLAPGAQSEHSKDNRDDPPEMELSNFREHLNGRYSGSESVVTEVL
jgi:hypothetical protein